MASIYKVLGQSSPSASTYTTLYTAPTGNSAVVSTLAICNRGAVATFRVAVRPNGATLSNEHFIIYDNSINGGDSIFLTIGLTLFAGDVVSVYTNSSSMSFNLFGSEITP